MRYYLQNVKLPNGNFTTFKHTGMDATSTSNRNTRLHKTAKTADTDYKTSYANNFGYIDSSGKLVSGDPKYTSNVQSTYRVTTDEYINIVGFRTPTIDMDGPQISSGSDAERIGTSGFSMYYERNKHGLYITNMYGCDRPNWHYDYWITVNMNVLFETQFNDIVFESDERLEPSKGEDGGEGKTGIKKNDKLSEIFGQGKVKVPDALTDEHYIFDGFYEDAEFQHLIWKPGETSNWTMPNHETNIYCKWIPPVRKVQFYDYTQNSGTGQ